MVIFNSCVNGPLAQLVERLHGMQEVAGSRPTRSTLINGDDMAEITLKCANCGQEFVFTEGEQSFYRRKGLPAGRQGLATPTLCLICRSMKQAEAADIGKYVKKS